MGFRLAGHILENVTGVTPTQKLILIGLAERAGPDGRDAFPGNTTLAKYAVCTGRNVEIALKELRTSQDGEAAWIGVQTPATNRKPTIYYINLEKLIGYVVGSEEPSGQTTRPPKPHRKTYGKSGRGERTSPLDGGGEESSPQPSAPEPRGEEISTAGANFSASRGEETSPDPIRRSDPGSDPEIHTDADASLFALEASQPDARTVLKARFERVTAIYPRGARLEAAFKAFARLKPSDALVELILADIEQKKRTVWGGVEPKFIPHLGNYFREKRWTDGEDVSPVSEAELSSARSLLGRRYLGRCPHQPVCVATIECLKSIALRAREKVHGHQRAS